jgi:hypothetical protein
MPLQRSSSATCAAARVKRRQLNTLLETYVYIGFLHSSLGIAK